AEMRPKRLQVTDDLGGGVPGQLLRSDRRLVGRRRRCGTIDEAMLRLEGLDRRLRRAFHIVFFDPRGVGGSGARDCPSAARDWDQAVGSDAEAAQTFVTACLAEASVAPEELPRYATSQVVGDLEALRAHLGHERLVLYGESYGTEVAQAYAIAHPDRVEALVLDAPVDLAMSPHAFWLEAARGFGETLEQTFDACEGEPVCDFMPSPARTYQRTVERLRAESVTVDVPDGSGGTVAHLVTLEMFESMVASAMYDPTGRGIVLRALAEVERGRWDYLARVLGDGSMAWEVDGLSSFAYYAVSCADEPFGGPADVDDYLDRAQAAGIEDEPLGRVYYSGLPCLFWPHAPDADSPGLSNAPFPVLVLTATADPITTAGSARALAARQPRAFLVETEGGAHVTFGAGDSCVDAVVVELLVDRTEPRSTTRCRAEVADVELGITPLDADDYIDALDAVASLDVELWAAPELYWWDGVESVTFGCRYGGGVRASWDGDLVRVTLFDCAWADGLALDGNGTLDFESGETRLRIVAPDTDVRYESGVGGWSIAGTWEGEPVDESG
ncbi:MAG TPA: alpha/beta fold hydrolase, partial [Vitreimonas sp.]|nr:alpha/beta fold hydrolase [Vitreimonas sp.]